MPRPIALRINNSRHAGHPFPCAAAWLGQKANANQPAAGDGVYIFWKSLAAAYILMDKTRSNTLGRCSVRNEVSTRALQGTAVIARRHAVDAFVGRHLGATSKDGWVISQHVHGRLRTEHDFDCREEEADR